MIMMMSITSSCYSQVTSAGRRDSPRVTSASYMYEILIGLTDNSDDNYRVHGFKLSLTSRLCHYPLLKIAYHLAYRSTQ